VLGWDDVVAIGSRFPGVEVGTRYGMPGLLAAGKGFCRLRTDPDALVLRVRDKRRSPGSPNRACAIVRRMDAQVRTLDVSGPVARHDARTSAS